MRTRKYSLDYDDPEAAARTTINMFRDGLLECRGRTDKPDLLEWEIRVYDFMLADPIQRLKEWQHVRFEDPDGTLHNRAPRDKRETVKILGWEIPARTEEVSDGEE